MILPISASQVSGITNYSLKFFNSTFSFFFVFFFLPFYQLSCFGIKIACYNQKNNNKKGLLKAL
jgi:hypothetical protein